jgi:hypothetical protein
MELIVNNFVACSRQWLWRRQMLRTDSFGLNFVPNQTSLLTVCQPRGSITIEPQQQGAIVISAKDGFVALRNDVAF